MVAAGTEVAAAVADAHRREWGLVLAATVRVTGDIDAAEEAVQDAYASALSTWPTRGIPHNTGAWLTTAARRRALDILRHERVAARALPRLVEPDGEDDGAQNGAFPDERLKLVFTCCHPSLAVEAQVALTLRLLCGLSTADVARAFLVPEPTMAARITRAKQKIARARIPYAVPAAAELPERVEAVLTVVHLVYTTGHTAPTGSDLMRRGLAERGLELAAMLRTLLPGDPEVAGLLALVLLTDARRDARVDERGDIVLLEDQDRSRWDRRSIETGLRLLGAAFAAEHPGRFALMAAIAAVHDRSEEWSDTDWPEIVSLYDLLIELWPSPVVALNRAVAIGFARGPEAGLRLLDELAGEPQLARYPYLQAARAELLARVGDLEGAVLAFDEAILLTENDAERRLLATRRAALDAS
jgi:predicted RNA polymerase sigma factor